MRHRARVGQSVGDEGLVLVAVVSLVLLALLAGGSYGCLLVLRETALLTTGATPASDTPGVSFEPARWRRSATACELAELPR